MTALPIGRLPVDRRWLATLLRHAAILALAALLVWLWTWLRHGWNPMHQWNRAFGDAAFILLALTMAIGPLGALVPAVRRLLPFRRELGIHAVLLASVHIWIVFAGWLQYDLARLAGLAFHPQLQRYVMVEHGLGLGNLVGLAAWLPAVLLLAISNDLALRRLGPRTWKLLQSAAGMIWVLTALHAVYFLFMHFQHFHQPGPPDNPFTPWFAALAIGVQLLRWTATTIVWRRQRAAA